jgi:hypothetical protein
MSTYTHTLTDGHQNSGGNLVLNFSKEIVNNMGRKFIHYFVKYLINHSGTIMFNFPISYQELSTLSPSLETRIRRSVFKSVKLYIHFG